MINSEFICDKCKTNYEDLIEILKEAKIEYKFKRTLVRGLDYYNGPVFEITSDNLGAQNAICGGGRYDGLVSLLGGPDTPAVGWALGMERLTSLIQYEHEDKLDAFIVTDNHNKAVVLADILRNSNLKVEMGFSGSNFRKQLDKANKFNAKFAVIMGTEEIEKNFYTVKNLKTGDQFQYDISDMIACLITNKE